MSRLVRIQAAVSTVLLAAFAGSAWGGEALRFNRDVRPILSENCFLCHGPDHNARKAGLRLDIRDFAISAEGGSAAIVPGDAENSALIKHIYAEDPDDLMPPPDSERKLTPVQRDTLKRWIQEGAAYEPQWSLVPVRRPVVPATTHSAATPVDAFVLRRLEREGLDPSPEASRATLLRRLSFDLIGLPPTDAEVEAFAADTAPDAYERQVDRLLASPHFGERLAMNWLDWVRYADTNGYHGDEYRNIYPYRDYVINAFNANMPYDRFTREQLAGDLLPNATIEQKIASGYNRLNQITAEGGAQAKEYIAMYAADRVRTTTSVWLGATMGCAQCHDHKFDPYTAKDFYSFAAFFADVDERGVYGAGQIWEPVLYLPEPGEQQAKVKEFADGLAALKRILDEPTPEGDAAYAAWLRGLEEADRNPVDYWTPFQADRAEAATGAAPVRQERNAVTVTTEVGETKIVTLGGAAPLERITAIRLQALARVNPADKTVPGTGVFELLRFSAAINGEAIAISEAVADFSQENFSIEGALDEDPKTAWAIQRHEHSTHHEAIFYLAEPLTVPQGAALTVALELRGQGGTAAQEHFRVAVSAHPRPELPLHKRVPRSILKLVRKDEAARSAEDVAAIRSEFLENAPFRKETRAKYDQLREAQRNYLLTLPRTLVSKSVTPREVRLLPRGNWMDDSGPIMEPDVPEVLPGLGVEGRRPTRLDLANWLIREDNPMTARVFVNRLWKQCFGTGLSKVLDDFGAQGEWPSHPELLDWLAAEFMDSGWDIKHVYRLITTSATYRQSSAIRKDLEVIDPYNRLLARQSQYRLPAELLRDNALALSGLLSSKIGGRSVYPYQPEGYYANCNTFTGPLVYTPDTGEDQYRRGLYTFWKRSFLHPSMMAFDAPTREECTAERTVSNTPLQALVLLNDPTYVEAARALATRIYTEGGADPASRIRWAFKHLLSRAPTEDESRLLIQLFEKHRSAFAAAPEGAAAYIKVGFSLPQEDIPPAELAGWTSVARTLLNLHETITRT